MVIILKVIANRHINNFRLWGLTVAVSQNNHKMYGFSPTGCYFLLT